MGERHGKHSSRQVDLPRLHRLSHHRRNHGRVRRRGAAEPEFFDALGDGGSGNQTGNGLTNLDYNETSAYGVLVGGTSLSNLVAASNDPTLLSSVVGPALAGSPATIWQLAAGGLTVLPADATALQFFVETVWNQYVVTGTQISGVGGGYISNNTTSGGVDPTQPTPAYQVD